MNPDIFVAEAKGYISTAANLEKKGGDLEKISKLYRLAAEKYFEAYQHSRDKGLLQLSEKYLEKSKLYAPKKKIRVQSGASGSERHFKPIEPGLSFEDVAGMYELKERMEEVMIWPIIYPEEYEKYAGKIVQGILLYGPPGCGKSYIVEAAAGEAQKRCEQNVNFYQYRASDIKNAWVGESEKNIRAAFEIAASNEPAIVFFDEIDGLGKTRKGEVGYADDLVSEFLQSFKLIESKTVIVIGATNFPWQVDPALRRPGRLGGRRLLVPPPDLEARLELFRLYTKNKLVDENTDYQRLAQLTKGYSCADIAQICHDAGLLAFRHKLKSQKDQKITQADFEAVIRQTKSSLTGWINEVKKRSQQGEPIELELLELVEKYNLKNLTN